ncbi:ABC-F family ATP-binding cassette domain-containing protein [Candidatus Phycosocius bacilliformis]|nr:ATP-binding cassette domain-containing protein [Candidatus Phycosocius bacilliformis]
MQPMSRDIVIQLKDIALTRGGAPVFTGVDLTLRRGERAALVGANGAGKSTLMAVLAGTLETDRGERVVATGTHAATQTQEPDFSGTASLLDWVVQDVPHDRDEPARLAAAAAELDSFGLAADRPVTALSGGEARRAALARAFAADPDLLMLDEPTNHLDIAAIEELERRLKQFSGAVLVVSHDRAFLSAISTTCLWLRHGVVRRLDAPFAKFDAWAESIEEQDRKALEKLDKTLEDETRWLARGVTARRTRNEGRLRRLMAMREARKGQAALVRKDSAALQAETGAISGKLVFEAKGVSKGFSGRGDLIKGLDLRVMRGDRLGIVGPNGVGKSTLIKMLVGDLAPDSGTMRIGKNLTIAYLDQSRAALDPAASLWETFAPAGGDQIMVRDRPRHVAAYAKDFLFDSRHLRQPVGSFSGGERNRVLLALTLAKPSNVLVLDEPTNDLDMETLDVLEDMLADYDGTVLLVSHDRAFLDGVVTATLAPCGDGRWIETPGGWSDLVRQGVPMLGRKPVAKAKTTPSAPHNQSADPSPNKTAKKLSYKDERRLAELEALMPELEREIARLEAELADPGLYTRDPARFERTSAQAVAARSRLEAGEEEWLGLVELKESLAAGA